MALNLVNVATITGKTAVLTGFLSTTVFEPSVTAAANQLVKLNSLYAVNTSATPYTATVDILRGSTLHPIASALACAANTTTVIVIKDSPIYLEEGDVLKAFGSNAAIKMIASYDLLA